MSKSGHLSRFEKLTISTFSIHIDRLTIHMGSENLPWSPDSLIETFYEAGRFQPSIRLRLRHESAVEDGFAYRCEVVRGREVASPAMSCQWMQPIVRLRNARTV